MNKVKKANKSYKKTIAEVRSKKWASPFGKTLSITGHILNTAGKCGAPFVGILGSALVAGSQVLQYLLSSF